MKLLETNELIDLHGLELWTIVRDYCDWRRERPRPRQLLEKAKLKREPGTVRVMKMRVSVDCRDTTMWRHLLKSMEDAS